MYAQAMPAGIFISNDILSLPDLSCEEKLIWAMYLTSLSSSGQPDYQAIGNTLGIDPKNVERTILKISHYKYKLNSFLGKNLILYFVEYNLLPSESNAQQSCAPLTEEEAGGEVNETGTTFPTVDKAARIRQLAAEHKNKITSKTPKPLPPIAPPRETQAIIDLWNGLGLTKHKNPDTKVYRQAVNDIARLVRGAFFKGRLNGGQENRRFTYSEIATAIQNFALAATNPDYQPSNGYKNKLRGYSLPQFFWSEFAEKNKSLFLIYLEGPPPLCDNPVRAEAELNPRLTNRIKALYQKSLGGVVPSNYTSSQQNKFIRSANRLHTFFTKVRGQFNSPTSVYEVADMMYDALLDDKGGDPSKIEIGHFCSDRMFDKLLPAYLNKQSILNSD